jgi:hypothetical protein
MTWVSIFELLAAISAVVTVWVYGNKNNYAPLYGMFSNIIWITWSVMSNSLFMLVMCIVFTALHIRNYFHMRKIK